MAPRRAVGFVLAVFAGAVLLSLGIWRWQGETTLQGFGDDLFWVSLSICAFGGLISYGASGTGRRVEHYTELHQGAEEIRRLHFKNRQAGLSVGLLIFLAGLLPGAAAYLIAHYAR